jgi:hypothetical protein
MKVELASIVRSEPRSKRSSVPALRPRAKAPSIELAAISALGMHFNLRATDNKAFTTSLYKIDRILSDRAAESASNESASDEALV